jgi:hypothetical protein
MINQHGCTGSERARREAANRGAINENRLPNQHRVPSPTTTAPTTIRSLQLGMHPRGFLSSFPGHRASLAAITGGLMS